MYSVDFLTLDEQCPHEISWAILYKILHQMLEHVKLTLKFSSEALLSIISS